MSSKWLTQKGQSLLISMPILFKYSLIEILSLMRSQAKFVVGVRFNFPQFSLGIKISKYGFNFLLS